MAAVREDEGSSGGHEGGGLMRWLLTYADLITLLMVFFVVMYSMSRLDLEKYRALAESLNISLRGAGSSRGGTGGPGSGEGIGGQIEPDDLHEVQLPLPSGGASVQPLTLEQTQGLIEQIVKNAGLQGSIEARATERGLVITLTEASFFDVGVADLRPESSRILLQMAAVLDQIPNQISVEGSTDDLPINTREFPTNWELSAKRAINVVRLLTEQGGLDPRRFTVTAYGEWHPRYPNTSEENRAKNRRVDLVLLAR